MTTGPVRQRSGSEVLGFGVPAALFLAGAAYLGLANGPHFIDNAVVAVLYAVAGTSFAAVPLLAWRRGKGRYEDPGFGRSAWFPWLFTTAQGVAYSSRRGDSSYVVLTLGWGVFIAAGLVALYFLGRVLWAVDGPAAPEPDGATARPELHDPETGA